MISSNKTPIRYQAELVQQFSQLIDQEHEISWDSHPLTGKGELSELSLSFDGHTHRFKPQYSVAPTTEEIARLAAHSKPANLLVVPRLTASLVEVCKKARLSAADLNGRLYLRGPGLLIDRRALPGRDFRFELEPRNIFVGKSVRIVRTLLTDPQRPWTQAELVKRSGASSGLVSRITTHLLRQGLLKKVDARRFYVTTTSLLLDAWAEADDFPRRVSTHRYTALTTEPLNLARSLRNALVHSPDAPLFTFTQWTAAWLRHPYTEPPVVSLYVSRLPGSDVLEKLGLRPVNDAGRVWFYIPTDEGVFLERQTVETLPLATDAQIYIDLLNTGLRGPDQAQALRKWEGFCRP
jgi:hypothetical protein